MMDKHQIEHKYSPKEKLQWWAEGEWVNEPDLVAFEHMGIECIVLRVAMQEPFAKDFHVFGGYLNGYVSIPEGHPYSGKDLDEMNIDCHEGLTFSKDGWIGFDCAHSQDYVPSTEHLKKTASWMQEYRDREKELKDKFDMHDSPIFHNSYKNIEFVIGECKSIAEQLIEIGKNHHDHLRVIL